MHWCFLAINARGEKTGERHCRARRTAAWEFASKQSLTSKRYDRTKPDTSTCISVGI